MKFLPTLSLWAATLLPLASASNGLAVRNAPGSSTRDTIAAVARALRLMSRQQTNNLFENSTSIARSYENATLLKVSGEVPFQTRQGNGTVEAGIEVICTTCYFTADVAVSLTIESDVDFGDTISNFSSAVIDEFQNVTEVVVDWIGETTDSAFKSFVAVFDFDDETDPADIDFPTLDVDFNIDIPEDVLPETNLRIQLDALDLYLEIDLTLSAGVSYTIPLLPPQAHPMGLAKSSDLFIGTVLALELILNAEGEVELSTGVHISLDDDVVLEIALFGKNITNSQFPGGSVEFLPVTVHSGTVTLSAILQVSAHTGFNLDIPNVPDWLEGFLPAAGVEAFVFANLAEFTTSIEGENEDTDGDGCLLNIAQDFKFAVGAGAGATIELAGETWGPNPETTIELWTTTIAEICGNSATPTAVPTQNSVVERQVGEDLSTATTKTTLQYTGIVCMSSLKQCPASLQKHTVATSVQTLTSILPSGETPAWPSAATAFENIRSKISFGTGVQKLFAASGTPTPGLGNDPDNIFEEAVDKVKGVDKRIIIGVCVGVGGLLLIIIGVVVALCIKKRRKGGAVSEPFIPRGPVTTQVGDSGYYGAGYGAGGYGGPLPSPGIAKEKVNVTYSSGEVR